jgi:sulfur-carrier protein adenylyltransferase/sulfurtransferase
MGNSNFYKQYHRQIILQGFGYQAQQKLSSAKVLVIGAGGLGCPALQYLAAAGIGCIGIVDDDVVSLSNLQRQILFTFADIGFQKASCAAEKLTALNPEIEIITYPQRLTTKNALGILNRYDIILDGTDNFASRYLINDAAFLLKKPLVYGAVSAFEGQLAVFNVNRTGGNPSCNYRDIFPVPPDENTVLNCSEAGVLGVLPGIIGTMMASETIKQITGIGNPLINQLLTYNCLTNQVYTMGLEKSNQSAGLMPANKMAFEKTNYESFCGTQRFDFEIEPETLRSMLSDRALTIIDLRDWDEIPEMEGIEGVELLRIPLAALAENLATAPAGTVVMVCQTGKRSRQAVLQLREMKLTNTRFFSLRTGIVAWNETLAKN